MRSLSVLIVTVIATRAEAQTNPTAPSDVRLIAALDEFIPRALRWDGAPGITVAVGRGGRLIYERGFGWADLARKIPMRAGTVTRAGSMSKPYTGTAIMQLVDREVLDLDQPVSRYIREFPVTNPLGDRAITVRDLMTHVSGLSEFDARYAELSQTEAIGEYLKAVFTRSDDKGPDGKYVRWLGKVGERSSYSNIGITLLGYLVAVTNPERLPFPDYVRRYIQEPLGMRVSHFPVDQNEPAQPADLSTGYAAIGDLLLPAPRLWTPVQPAGTLYATAAEHLRLVQAFLGGGSYGGKTILSQAGATAMISPTVSFGSGGGHVGLVWMLSDEDQPYASFHHAGAYMYGWTNAGVGFPRYDVGVVATVNRWPMQSYGTGARAEQLVADFIGRWLAFEDGNPAVRFPVRSWAWKRSYLIGLVMAHAYHGQLQARTRLTEARLTAMSRAVPRAGGSLVGRWDAAGFRAGYQDLAPIATDQAAIKTLLGSRSLKVHPAELDLLFADIGGRGGLPAP
jgi:CubicO group peptidase (beta-lactamase class C family)